MRASVSLLLHVHLVALVVLLGACVANAQQIVESVSSTTSVWSVDFSRNMDPGNCNEMIGVFSSREAARAAAQGFKALAGTTGDWGVAKICIQGPSNGAVEIGAIGPRLPSWNAIVFDLASELGKTTREVMDVTKPGVEGAYERAKKLREFALTSLVETNTKQFELMNQAISEYNEQVEASGLASARLAMVEDPEELLNQGNQWRETVQEQFTIEQEQQELEDIQRNLVEERMQVIEEKSALRRLEAEVARLSNRATENSLAGRTANGTFITPSGRSVSVTYQFFEGGKLRYTGGTEVLSGTYSVSGNTVKMQMGTTTQNGTIRGDSIVMDTLSRDGRGSERITVPGLAARVQQSIRPRQDDLNQKRARYPQRMQSYRSRLSSYNQRLSGYERRNQQLNQALRSMPVRRPTGARPIVPRR